METIETIIQWHRETFPDATEKGQCSKWYDEMVEFTCATISNNYKDTLLELADLFIVACGLARLRPIRAGGYFGIITGLMGIYQISEMQLKDAVDKKMQINRGRQWDFKGGKYHHIAGKGGSPAADLGTGIGGQSNK